MNKKEKSFFQLLLEYFKNKFFKIYNALHHFTNQVSTDCVTAFSGEATLFIIISFFPFIIMLLIILQLTPLSSDAFIKILTEIVPSGFRDYITNIINDLFAPTTAVISVSTVTVFWSASRGFLAIVRGFNVIYKTGETRNFLVLRFFSLLYTIGFAVIVIITLVLLVFGNKLSDYLIKKLPKFIDLAVLIISIRATVILSILLIFFLILYVAVPNRKTSLLCELPGAIVSSLGWLIYSYAFSYYVDNYSNYTSMYGNLTSIVLIMIWMYFCMYIMFLGAEINVVFGHSIEHYIKKKRSKKIKTLKERIRK